MSSGRMVGFGILVFVVVALLGTGAWLLEGGTIVAKPDSKASSEEFVVDLPPKEAGMDLVIQCNEERFQGAYKKFREEHLDIDTEPIAVPGGIKALAAVEGELPKELEPVKRAIVEALKRHSPRRIVLTAHSYCLIYDVIAAWQNASDRKRIEWQQVTDLQEARDLIRSWLPDTQVDVYYAQIEGNRLRFKTLLKEEVK